MAQQITSGGLTYTSAYDIDIAAIVEKIKKAQAGENVPGVSVVNLPNPQIEDQEQSPFSLTTLLLLGALAYIILKPSKSKK